MKPLQRDTRIKLSHNPTGEILVAMQRLCKYNKLKKQRKNSYESNSRTNSK